MKDNENQTLGGLTFIRSHEAWYGQPGFGNEALVKREEFDIQDEKTGQELMIRYKNMGDKPEEPRLEAFPDSWTILPKVVSFLQTLAEEYGNANINPDDLNKALLEHGAVDKTEREYPYNPGMTPA